MSPHPGARERPPPRAPMALSWGFHAGFRGVLSRFPLSPESRTIPSPAEAIPLESQGQAHAARARHPGRDSGFL
jgi:hypothetical protein